MDLREFAFIRGHVFQKSGFVETRFLFFIQSPITLDILLGLIFVILWSSASIAAKVGIRDAAPLTMLDLRFFLAGAALLTYAYGFRRDTPRPKTGDWKHIIVLGLTNSTGYLGLSWLAFTQVPAGLFGLFIAMNPLIVAVLSWLWLKRPITRNEVIGIALGAAGLVVAATPRVQGKEATPIGIAMVVAAMVIYSFGSVYFKWSKLQIGGLALNAWQVMIGAVTLLPIALYANHAQPINVTPSFVFALAWSVIAVSIVANLLWFWLLKKDALRASMWLFLNPVSGYVLAALILGEAIRVTDMIGLVLVMAGLMISGVIDVRRLFAKRAEVVAT
jgi:drug/metabolite transporter (DMT)-like permease